ncbi:helix-turn-helix transcriptional regulator [Methylobacterium sp. CM6241]
MVTGDAHTHSIPSSNTTTVLRLPAVCTAAGVSMSTLRRLIKAGCGPRIIQLSERCIGIRRCDLEEWLASRSR